MRPLRVLPGLLALALLAPFAGSARAFPDGGPWGASNPSSEQTCATCHFEYEAVANSGAISIDGWPAELLPDETYDLVIRFDDRDAVVAGFQVVVESACDEAGHFVRAPDDVEFFGGAIRSRRPREMDNGVTWAVQWKAPSRICLPIVFHVAASAANNDGSPFGDIIHFRQYVVP